jgi:hypothetical protein
MDNNENNYRMELLQTAAVQSLLRTVRDAQIVAGMQIMEQTRAEVMATAAAQLSVLMRQWERERIEELIVKNAAQKQYISSLATGYIPARPRPRLVPPSDLGEIG